jgi:hypothetical protein
MCIDLYIGIFGKNFIDIDFNKKELFSMSYINRIIKTLLFEHIYDTCIDPIDITKNISWAVMIFLEIFIR